MNLNLYRAQYLRTDGRPRFLTFAAKDAAEALRFAAQWTAGDELTGLRLDRPLQAPLLVLT